LGSQALLEPLAELLQLEHVQQFYVRVAVSQNRLLVGQSLPYSISDGTLFVMRPLIAS
jgi:hypothetical protein